MGYVELEQKIRAEFQLELNQIREECAAKKEAIKADTQKAAEKRAHDILVNAEKTAALNQQRILDGARSRAATFVCAEKTKALGAAFELAKKRVFDLSDKEKVRIINLLAQDRNSIDGKKTILISPAYAKMLQPAQDIEVRVEDIGDIGLIIRSADGLVTIDNRITELIDSNKMRLKPKIGSMLFG